jgi:hypothetical protein
LVGTVLLSSAALAAGPNYKLASKVKVPFGKADEFYILDIADVDGDGADDFAVSAMTTGGNFTGGAAKPGDKVHSFVVRNNTKSGKLELTDLGEDGLTWRTRLQVLGDGGTGTVAVAFLKDPTRKCSDLVVLRRNSNLERYVCK